MDPKNALLEMYEPECARLQQVCNELLEDQAALRLAALDPKVQPKLVHEAKLLRGKFELFKEKCASLRKCVRKEWQDSNSRNVGRVLQLKLVAGKPRKGFLAMPVFLARYRNGKECLVVAERYTERSAMLEAGMCLKCVEQQRGAPFHAKEFAHFVSCFSDAPPNWQANLEEELLYRHMSFSDSRYLEYFPPRCLVKPWLLPLEYAKYWWDKAKREKLYQACKCEK